MTVIDAFKSLFTSRGVLFIGLACLFIYQVIQVIAVFSNV